MNKAKIAIIGGGAAGLMAAATLIENNADADIHLFEKNKGLGAKVIISGGGRCNVTTGIRDKRTLLSKYTRGADFLKEALGQFSPKKVYEWFENHGVALKIEDDLRVFPKSNNGKDIVAVFEKLFKNILTIHFHEAIISMQKKSENTCTLTSNAQSYEFNYIVITTGGNAYRHTGSTGDGYTFAQSIGHTITPLGPSLNSFLCKEKWPQEISGISLINAELTVDKKTVNGPILFTHFGLSGPATFALSSHLAFEKISPNTPKIIHIALDAEKKYTDWNNQLIEHFSQNGTQQIHTALKKFIPQRLASIILKQAHIEMQKKNCEITKDERNTLCTILSGGLTLTAINRRPGDEFVTAGGVSLTEVNKKTLQSMLHPSVFFAGEILDVDGVTGGFNLQASWATGRLAGKSITALLE